MSSTISFPGSNYGSQIGANYGSVTNEFHLPFDLDDKLAPVPGAAFDSYIDQHEHQCLPGTRTDLLSQIRDWASSPQGRCIFWLNGIAGTGKSTISRTMAKSFSLSKSLGASFFFKRGEGDRGNARKLFPTLARQLAISIPQITPVLQKTVRDNPGIITKTMREQFEKLLLQPLQSLERSKIPIQTMVIVIDALDECDGDGDIRLILQLLPQLQNLAAMRLRVLLTSRPDLPIRLGFSKITNDAYKDLILHEIPIEVIKHDISVFFDHRLKDIRMERFLSTDWPGDRDLQKLVALSVPLFIFAATICRIFEDPVWDPRDSLIEILTHQYDQSKLDQTYLPVLNRLINTQHEKHKAKLVSEFQQVIGAIVILANPLSVISLSKLLRLPERLIHLRLAPLHSVLKVPDNGTIPVRLFHLSFRDYLLDPETRKKSPFGVNERAMHCELAKKCLLMCQSLRRNICELPSNGTERAEIDHQTIESNLPPELQYACRYWAYHLVKCAGMKSMMYTVLLFLQRHFLRKHFLHWVEAMSLLGLTSEILGILDCLQTAIPGNDPFLVSDFLHDAKRFILKNHQIIDQAPLQIYCAGLIFAPQTAIIRTQFKQEIPTWICQLPQVEERWSAELQTLEGHLHSVQSVTFSPVGRLLASGSFDHKVRLWDPASGALTQILEGHSHWVLSVAFSPDGRLLASGSWDNTVRLWDPATGALQRTIDGHSDTVQTVAFSPDGRLLASGSEDETVRLWDPTMGVLTQTLEGHSGGVSSVTFSPDGRLLAAGSETVRLWDPTTGVLTQTLEGHSAGVSSVTFSPDGRLLATGSGDHKVRLWDPATGALTQILEGHSQWVLSVAFSLDGRLLASSSEDKTVRLWDPATGAPIQTLEGHLSPVRSVSFSPDGRLLASGSLDNTVRLWDPATRQPTQTHEGHLSPVRSVAFSPDGRLLASVSWDNTVRLWDPATGALQRTIDGHSDRVQTVAFSPDGRLLASGSGDKTVRLWDLTMGVLTQTLEGHSAGVSSVTFSPDGRLLAAGSDDHKVRLWDLAMGALTQTLEGHSAGVNSMAFSPDGRLLASGSWDKIVRIWDPSTGALIQTWNVEKLVFKLEFSCDGLYLHTNFGILDIQSRYDILKALPSHASQGISVENEIWIKLNGEKVLWLAIESRPTCSEVKDNILALGHKSGRVSFIGFCI